MGAISLRVPPLGSLPFSRGKQVQIDRPGQAKPKISPIDRPTLDPDLHIEGYGPF
jgi:hypothetical protein